MKANGAVHIGNKLDRVGEFRRHVLSFTADRVAQPEATLLGCKFAQPCLAGRRARHAVPRLTALCSEAVIQAHFLAGHAGIYRGGYFFPGSGGATTASSSSRIAAAAA